VFVKNLYILCSFFSSALWSMGKITGQERTKTSNKTTTRQTEKKENKTKYNQKIKKAIDINITQVMVGKQWVKS